MAIKQGFGASVSRILGFVKKELLTVIRQPRLILTLVVGPFLILLIFGLGYRDAPPPFKTLIVLPSQEATLAADLEELSDSFGSSIDLVGTTQDADDGRAQLRSGDIDLLIIAPDNAVETLEEGERADFKVVHTQVDPVLRSSISLLSRLSIDEINRRVLATFLDRAQQDSTKLNAPIAEMRESAGRLSAAIEAGDQTAADEERVLLRDDLELVETTSGGNVYEGVANALGVNNESVVDQVSAELDRSSLAGDELSLQSARSLEESLAELENQLERAQGIEAGLIVRPFGSDVDLLTDFTNQPAIFYAPGVLILLIQHLAVTFAALSLVRERELGLTEIFRVSPLRASEALAGKYVAFTLVAGFVATALAGTMLLLGVPVRSSPWLAGGIVGLVILASLGLGFLISGISKTDSQAIQYSMIVLLVSIFFTGFVLPLQQLIPAVQAVSYLIPATYAIQALHDVMFRGVAANQLVIGGLGVYALIMMTVALFVTRKDVNSVAS